MSELQPGEHYERINYHVPELAWSDPITGSWEFVVRDGVALLDALIEAFRESIATAGVEVMRDATNIDTWNWGDLINLTDPERMEARGVRLIERPVMPTHIVDHDETLWSVEDFPEGANVDV